MYKGSGTIRPQDIRQTCTACPSQWEGRLSDGRVFYARFRSSNFRVFVGKVPTEDWSSYDDLDLIYSEFIGDGWDGSMTTNELLNKLLDHGNGILRVSFFDRLYIRSMLIWEPVSFKTRKFFWDVFYKTPMGKRYSEKRMRELENLFRSMRKPNSDEEPNVQD